jgi:hypothetical protein
LDRIAPLVVLKARLMFRVGKGVGPIIVWTLWLVGFIGPLALGAAALTFTGFFTQDGAGRRELLNLVLFGVWAFWLIFPLIGFSLNQSYDLTKLFIYPISRMTIFVGNTLACFLDPTLLIVLPTFAIITYFYSTTPLAVAVTALALLLFLAHTLALSQTLLWALLNILRSRRTRDWALLLVPLVALAMYLAPNLYVNAASGADPFKTLLGWGPSRYLFFAPSGVTAHAIEAAARGRWPEALAHIGALIAYLIAALGAGAFVLGRLHGGEIGAYPVAPAAGERATEAGLLARLATTPPAALAVKEWRYYWREPRYRSMFVAPLFPLIFVIGGSLARGHGAGLGFSPTAGVLFVAVLALFGFGSLFQNVFGIDREGLRLLFVTPCPRAHLLIGKNVAAVSVAWLGSAVAVVIAGIVLHGPYLAVMCVPFLLALAVVLAATGNVVSIHFPIRIARRGENPFASSSGRGCINALIGTLAFQVSLLVGAPVVAAAALPVILHAPLAYAFCVPSALVYSLLLYVAVLKLYSAPALERREMDILEECLAGEPVG